MLFAVVDIETTGGTPSNSRITEICAVITDGEKVHQVFETLLNPGCSIPRSITALTGITNEMVETAPVFADIAQELHHLLHDKVFVAHNVNFDYSFIHREFEKIGLPFSLPKICSARTARKAFPGKRSYGLGSICASLGIEIENRHRAGGDAKATAQLFHKIRETLGADKLLELAGRNAKALVLPPAIEAADIEKLPSTAGVYYFMNAAGKPLYIGKAINLKSRVVQHFDRKRGKTALQLEQIAGIDFEETGNELLALLVEADAIQKHWPAWNKAGKYPANRYSIVHYATGQGELRLQTIRKARNSKGGIGFPRLGDARNALARMIEENGICSNLAHTSKVCFDPLCYCKEATHVRMNIHNAKILQAVASFGLNKNEILILARGRDEAETAIIYMADGAVMGWGFANEIPEFPDPDLLVKPVKDQIELRAIANSFLKGIKAGTRFGYSIIPLQKMDVKVAAEPVAVYTMDEIAEPITRDKSSMKKQLQKQAKSNEKKLSKAKNEN